MGTYTADKNKNKCNHLNKQGGMTLQSAATMKYQNKLNRDIYKC